MGKTTTATTDYTRTYRAARVFSVSVSVSVCVWSGGENVKCCNNKMRMWTTAAAAATDGSRRSRTRSWPHWNWQAQLPPLGGLYCFASSLVLFLLLLLLCGRTGERAGVRSCSVKCRDEGWRGRPLTAAGAITLEHGKGKGGDSDSDLDGRIIKKKKERRWGRCCQK